MEVAVLGATGAPPKAVLGLRAGGSRQQAQIELGRKLPLPGLGQGGGSVQVSLFQQLGSAYVPPDGSADADSVIIPLAPPAGAGPSKPVKLQVRTLARSAALEKDYMQAHGLQDLIQDLIHQVLREQPQDPWRMILESLRDLHGAAGKKGLKSVEPSEPLSPKEVVLEQASEPVTPSSPARPAGAPTGRPVGRYRRPGSRGNKAGEVEVSVRLEDEAESREAANVLIRLSLKNATPGSSDGADAPLRSVSKQSTKEDREAARAVAGAAYESFGVRSSFTPREDTSAYRGSLYGDACTRIEVKTNEARTASLGYLGNLGRRLSQELSTPV